MKKTVIISTVVVLILIFGGVFFFMNSNRNMNNKNITSMQEKNNLNEVIIEGFTFSPKTITIKVGETITWINRDPTSHPIQSDTGDEISSGNLPKDQTYSHTFNTAGTYAYYCTAHPSMRGAVIVE